MEEEAGSVSELSDEEDSDLEDDATDLDDERPGTLRYHLNHLNDPITPGARISVLQYCYVRMLEKQRSRTKDTYFDRDCRFFSACCGSAQDNLRPPSFDMVKKILGTREAHECERHVCPCDRHVYKAAQPGEYRNHAEDKCPRCQTPRFDKVTPTLQD